MDTQPLSRLGAAADKVAESRKLLGFVIAVVAVVFMLEIFIICSAMLGTPWGPFQDVLQWITAITGLHQGSQGASDWMKWRSGNPATASQFVGSPPGPYAVPPAPSSATPPWTPPPGTGAQV